MCSEHVYLSFHNLNFIFVDCREEDGEKDISDERESLMGCLLHTSHTPPHPHPHPRHQTCSLASCALRDSSLTSWRLGQRPAPAPRLPPRHQLSFFLVAF